MTLASSVAPSVGSATPRAGVTSHPWVWFGVRRLARLVVSLWVLVTVLVAVPLGVAMGVLTRRGHGRRTELAFTTTSVVLGIVPDFLVGVLLVYVFGVNLGWLPVAGNETPSAYVL